LRIERCRLWAGAAGQMRKTNQISRRRRRLTEEIVQNEAKLGATGVCGQRQLPCGTWLGRGVKCAKRTQFGVGRAACYGDCAKRTQFGGIGLT
jgi:hypothetical protein